jgi:DNA-binding response OmpR family regulator
MDGQATALVIDDDDDIRTLICTVLTRAGVVVDSVDGGVAALAAAQLDRPAVYVLDVRMPDLHGHEVCRRLKSDSQTTAPVLMVSAEASDADIAAGFRAGCDDFLPKPFSPRELRRRLTQLLENAPASQLVA